MTENTDNKVPSTLPPPPELDASNIELASLVPDPPLTFTKADLQKLTKTELEGMPRVEFDTGNEGSNTDNHSCFRCIHCTECARCFDCAGCDGCTDCQNCTHCIDCTQCLRCIDCEGCHGCVDCIGLKNANGLCMVVFGVQLNKIEYDEILAKLNAPDEEAPDSSEGESDGLSDDESDESDESDEE